MNRASRRQQQKLAKKAAKGKGPHGPPPGGAAANEIAGLFNQAVQHHQNGRLPEAEALYRRILKLFPDHVDALHLLGVIAAQSGNRAAAVDLISKAVKLHPGHADAHNNLGNVLAELGRHEEAAASYQTALKLAPGNAQAHNNLGIALKNLGRLDEAVEAYQKALSLAPGYFEAENNLGNALRSLGRPDEALARIEEVISAQPEFAPAHNSLGNAQMDLGHMAEAAKSFRQAIALKPDYAEAHRQLALISDHEDHDDEIKAMRTIYESGTVGAGQKMHLAFGLGKALEDIGDYDEAFDFFLSANALRQETEGRTAAPQDDFFKSLRETFSAGMFERFSADGQRDGTPVFILGMMRSGTSLIEQILASHSRLHGAGERNSLERIIHASLKGFAEGDVSAALSRVDANTLKRMGSAYVDELKSQAPEVELISDKLPANFLHIGLIKLMLPEAKVIHCRRDPVDTCLSIFKNYFSTSSHDYAYELEALGRYYGLYDKLMAHWHEVLPGFVHDVVYEDLVADQEGETRALLDFCGLDWEAACLDFHNTKRSVRTASAAQVQKPLYADSVQSWRRYEKQLAPLLNALPENLA